MRTFRGSQVLSRVGGSFLTALAGMLAGVVVMRLVGWDNSRACFLMIGLFVGPVWLLVLLPLHVLVPCSSWFWNPGVSAGTGAGLGAILLVAYFLLSGLADLLWLFLPLGVFIGVVTGLVGSVIARRYAIPMA